MGLLSRLMSPPIAVLEEQGHALVSGATMHLLSVALCVTRAPVYDAVDWALTVRRAAQRAEDRT